ncbi:response regulator transcription factor [Dokdonella sp.]|uniref:response regulator transcription factor n=1 Tax=Dokdonella sp. TaxID=2291710 RepID=UPI0025C0A08D|nr:response regulator transcription factor [Dokdonella sp.]MBX3692853.1 response regulator transcription factor [Dokdonella sp.]MCW5569045.1 response regulator transcription factor [Dokdonella sp.]
MSFSVAVLEDDAEFRDTILVAELNALGFAAEGFATSTEMVRRMQQIRFDLAVLDVGLAGESGLDVARRLRATSPIGIVMLSGRGIQHERVLGLRESADAWLGKPVDIEVLAATLVSVGRRVHPEPVATSMAATPPAAAPGWHVDAAAWKLVAPNGQTLDLNRAERLLLAQLFAHAGEPVCREQLIAGITSMPDEFDPHRLDMLLHRLRRRVLLQLGASLPVRAVRGYGYVAVADGEDT